MSEPVTVDPMSMVTLKRFGLRAAILLILCSMSANPLPTLTVFASAFGLTCILIATWRREQVFGPCLNTWGEASFYLLMSHGGMVGERL